MDPSIRGYNEREQLPASGFDSTQMWGSLAGRGGRRRGSSRPTTVTSFSEPEPSTAQPCLHLTWIHSSRTFHAVMPRCCFVKLRATCKGHDVPSTELSTSAAIAAKSNIHKGGWIRTASAVVNEAHSTLNLPYIFLWCEEVTRSVTHCEFLICKLSGTRAFSGDNSEG